MMKNWILRFFWAIFGMLSFLHAEQPDLTLVLNKENQGQLPSRFRSTCEISESKSLNLEGLSDLHASGSAQFSEKGLQTILAELNIKNSSLYILDLRQESHGFLNGIAVSWFATKNWGNKGKSFTQIVHEEQTLLKQALKEKNVTIYKILGLSFDGSIKDKAPIPICVERAFTEKELVDAYHLHYIRIPVTDFTAPENQEVDAFISFIKKLPKKAWIHFHCEAGIGRTTTFLAMYDMILNAKKISFQDIINRQAEIGGKQLDDLVSEDQWKIPLYKERLAFLKQFYDYCKSQSIHNHFQKSWSNYKASL